MLNTKIAKENFDAELYAMCASWCNKNNAQIVETDTYYEVVENVVKEPTLAEQVKEINDYYNGRFDKLKTMILDRQMANLPYEDLQEQYKKLAPERITKIKALKGAK